MDKNVLRRRILLLLYAGIALGLASSPRRQYRIFGEFAKEWKKIGEQDVVKQIRPLARSKFLQIKKDQNGNVTIKITKKGTLKALQYHFDNMCKMQKWDGKWRIVIFDIPEKKRVSRNALRAKLRDLGFKELQKSVFVFPYECRKEIELIIDFFSLQPHVCYGVMEFIDKEENLKNQFQLS
jgi:DNA-binding transcriptional regulator PaaX